MEPGFLWVNHQNNMGFIAKIPAVSQIICILLLQPETRKICFALLYSLYRWEPTHFLFFAAFTHANMILDQNHTWVSCSCWYHPVWKVSERFVSGSNSS